MVAEAVEVARARGSYPDGISPVGHDLNWTMRTCHLRFITSCAAALTVSFAAQTPMVLDDSPGGSRARLA